MFSFFHILHTSDQSICHLLRIAIIRPSTSQYIPQNRILYPSQVYHTKPYSSPHKALPQEMIARHPIHRQSYQCIDSLFGTNTNAISYQKQPNSPPYSPEQNNHFPLKLRADLLLHQLCRYLQMGKLGSSLSELNLIRI